MIKQIIPAPGYFAVYDNDGRIERNELIAFALVDFDSEVFSGVYGMDQTCVSGLYCEDNPYFLGYDTPNGPSTNWSLVAEEMRNMRRPPADLSGIDTDEQ